MNVKVLSGGAAAAVVKGVEPVFNAKTGLKVEGVYSAVGQMRDQLLQGQPCDVIILTRAMIQALIESGHVVPGSARSLGLVRTGVAVRKGTPWPAISNREELTRAFRAARGIYFPDAVKSTAGVHFMKVLQALGLDQEKQPAFRQFPNGATAMREMGESDEDGLIGCTQVTEINYTPGVELVGMLPQEFELATDYTLGVCTAAAHPEAARVLADLVAGAASAAIRRQGGFEFDGA
jgi:molybdate transport system substrate-binding protein